MPESDVNLEFLNYLVEKTRVDERRLGKMSTVNYHKHYLIQEAINKLVEFNDMSQINKRKALDCLVAAARSIMGEYNRLTGYSS